MTEEVETKDVDVDEVQPNPDADYDEEEVDPVPFSLEDLKDNDEEMWPGGPTVGMMKEWKAHFGKLYITSIDADTHIVWRGISRPEYKAHVLAMERLNAQGNLSPSQITMKNEESLAAIGQLFPAYNPAVPDDGLAGIPSLIASEIMDASGFVAMSIKEV